MPGLTCGFDQTCVNLASDPRNCGVCGVACGSGQLCSEGGCVGRTADGSFLPSIRPGAAGPLDIVATGLGGVQGLLLSSDGQTAYVSATGAGVIWRVALQELPATPVRWAEGLTGPSQLTWDPMGAIVVAEREGDRVTRIALNGDGTAGPRTSLPHAFQGPWGVVFDAAGNLLVSNEFGDTVDRVTPSGEITRGVIPRFPAPLDLRYDLAGNLYVGDYGNPLTTGVNVFVHDAMLRRTRTVAGLLGPIGLAIDLAGDVYVANYRGNNVVRVSAAGAQTVYATGLVGPHAIAFDPRGRLYVADYGNQRLVRFRRP
jgi:sugar lactone lactonase YvrE